MIDIVGKDCTGCSSCTQRCPVKCISMQENDEGFLYPVIDTDTCIGCNMCERVCPVLNPGTPREPVVSYAYTNPDRDVLLQSSSGGVFYSLACDFINRGGAVFGARFNTEWKVEHACARTISEARAFMGSKYVQSSIGDTFVEAENLLKQKVPVLFTGTPCQIAGLKRYLRKSYPQLITAEVACHGVPSPGVWREYVADMQSKAGCGITGISFRSKKISWRNFGLRINFSNGREYFNTMWKDNYMTAFLRNMTLRYSCFSCRAKKGASHADITLGDFWGVESTAKQLYNPNGTSCVIAGSGKGEELLKRIAAAELRPVSYADVTAHNSALLHSVPQPLRRREFMQCFNEGGIAEFNRMTGGLRPTFAARLKSRLGGIVRKVASPLLGMLRGQHR